MIEMFIVDQIHRTVSNGRWRPSWVIAANYHGDKAIKMIVSKSFQRGDKF